MLLEISWECKPLLLYIPTHFRTENYDRVVFALGFLPSRDLLLKWLPVVIYFSRNSPHFCLGGLFRKCLYFSVVNGYKVDLRDLQNVTLFQLPEENMSSALLFSAI